jgi:von Willebrand factor A domain-containing protein 8
MKNEEEMPNQKTKRRLFILKCQLTEKQLSFEPTFSSLQIGNTKFNINNEVKFPQFVPNLFVPNFQFTKETMEHLQWISQKDSMQQDMFLIGHPGPHRRRIVFMYCELVKREIEYVVITRDTTEHDLKQRREIQNRNAFYVDQAAVRAAIHGRILILDGIEKSERNILPILNNLLENREMSLEDGRLLIDMNRYKKLNSKSTKIVPVHPEFRVIAIGLPIPPYEGNSLDPPLRSNIFHFIHSFR